MPRTPWRRRRTTDSPRPAGRRWAGRLRRGGSLARQALLVRVGRRSADSTPGRAATATKAEVIYTGTDLVPLGGRGRKLTTSGSHGPVAMAQPVVLDAVEDDSASLLPGEHTLRRRVSFALVNSCTLASLALGLMAIFLAMNGETRFAAGCLVACVAFDGLDGVLARRLGVSSPFGAQMDSLADMCSFGLAAPVVVYASLVSSVPTAAAAVACVLVASCAAIRLARFNVSPKDGKFFSGVPTTMAAAVLALTVLIGLPLPGIVVLGGVSVLAFAMVSSFPYAKLARIVKLPLWFWLLPIVGVLVEPRLTFVLVVATYLVSGPVMWLKDKRA
ncbi:CDP-alcohol phosphatidyltransferase family protein [Actinoplanes sp. NPDC051494]|uniref:CDP-alcohol phosphatidyltransferase family protein n=1 Tax=Actinoplanes sp. NPDC051494 TaxID=3363907 RepID=UPI0037B894ED